MTWDMFYVVMATQCYVGEEEEEEWWWQGEAEQR